MLSYFTLDPTPVRGQHRCRSKDSPPREALGAKVSLLAERLPYQKAQALLPINCVISLWTVVSLYNKA